MKLARNPHYIVLLMNQEIAAVRFARSTLSFWTRNVDYEIFNNSRSKQDSFANSCQEFDRIEKLYSKTMPYSSNVMPNSNGL